MLLVYSYNKVQELFNLFDEGKIVTLFVTKNNDSEYIMNYTRVEDYSEEERKEYQYQINSIVGIRNRLMTSKILNDFVKNEKANNLCDFYMEYDARKKEHALNYNIIRYKNLPDDEIIPSDNNNLFDELKELAVAKGRINTTVNAYKKIQGAGNKKQQVKLTINEVIDLLEETLGN